MSREEALAKLHILQGFRVSGFQGFRDKEIAHADADDVICDLLRSLGYEDVVEKYDKIEKWNS